MTRVYNIWDGRITALPALIIACAAPAPGLAAEALVPGVPAGFVAQLVAREPLVRNPCAMTFDARGRLFVGQGPQYRNPTPETPGDTIEILLDRDGDGVFDQTKTFARGLNCIQGLAWRGRDLWVANAPDLTIVRDLDGDDAADEYVLVYTDLGNIEHGLHGLNWAPDGKLYMSKGNSKGLSLPGRVAPKPFRELWDVAAPPGLPDLPPPRVFKADEYRNTYHDPRDDWGRMGGILRCDDLGANLEIVSRGFRNPWDIAFDSGFDWLGTDNDQAEGDRIFMPFFGAHFGWGHAWSADWTGADHLPTVPVSGPVFTGSGTGITFADTPGWPAAFRGVWFINDFLHRTTYVYRPRWVGARLQPEGGMWEPFARAGQALFHPIDIEPGPDGALYITGWGSSLAAQWRDGRQANEGRVFRIAPADLPKIDWNPAKRTKPLAQWTPAELFDDLGAVLPVWRTNAADELVRRGGSVQRELMSWLASGALPRGQETWGLWTLGRIEPQNREVDAWLDQTGRALSPNARVQALRIAAHRVREGQSGTPLARFVADALDDPEPRVRFNAVQAIMRARQSLLLEALCALAARETDRLVFYATWRALLEIAPVTALRARLADERPGVRRAALLALLEQGALREHEVEPLVKDSDASTAALAGSWLAKRSGNPLLVIAPPAGDFSGELRVSIVPGLKPSSVSVTTDGSEPDPAAGRSTARLSLTETTTVKAALFVDGKKIGHTAEVRYRLRGDVPAGSGLVLHPPAAPTTTAAVLDLLPAANPARGHEVFNAAGCFTCHRVNQDGGSFGPDLSAMGSRGNPEQLIRSILEPNADITEGFALLNVTTREGRSFAGRLHDESGDILTLVQPDGLHVALKRQDIAKREGTHASPMPPYDRVIGPRDLADLTAWLNRDRSSAVKLTTAAKTMPVAAASAGRAFAVQVAEDRVIITDGGAPVATYVFKDPQVLRPSFQNVHAPGGILITRRHPPEPPDAVDHPAMHPGVWLAFGDISGQDFWRNKARIEHEQFTKRPAAGDDAVTFATASRFVPLSGRPLATLRSNFELIRRPDAYLLIWDAEISPLEGDLVFGDQEEMGLALRMTGALTEKNGGAVTLSEGSVGAKASWGRVADWCVYSGMIEQRTVGAVIFAAAANPHRPWWHTRDYGLMVANSFGKRSQPASADGRIVIERGKTLRLRHGVLLFNAPAGAPPDFAAAYQTFNSTPSKQ